jgi:ATP-dependent DNA helicase RecG
VEVRLLSDRLVITNPGGLYGITVDSLGREGTTSARNARLLEILKYTRAADGARVVETLASGIPRVLAAAEADHLPPPEFQNADIRFTVLLRESSETGRAWPATVRLHGSERAIAGALSVAAKTVAELESELQMKGPNIRRVLRALVDKGVAVQEGGKGRTTTYRLRDDPRPLAR